MTWNYREDLSVENSLVLKGYRLIIPERLRPQMLSLVHQDHMGTEKCLLRAKDCMFWPGISRHQGTDFQLFYVYKVRKVTGKRTTGSVQPTKLSLADA